MSERSLLADMAERLFASHATPPSHVEPLAWDEAAWAQVDEVGLPRLFVDGGDWEDAGAVLRALGRHAVALPLADAMLAHLALNHAGIAAPDGLVMLAHGQASLAGDSLVGALNRVAWAAKASHLVVPIGAVAALVPMHEVNCVPAGANVTGEPISDIVLDGVVASVFPIPDMFAMGALSRTALMAGALDGVLAMSLQYAGERKQFGRPIGAFQAVQHLLAVLAEEAAAAGCAAAAASRAASHGLALLDIAAAKLRANQAAAIGAGIGHQVHGAIGFTREYRLHLLTRKLFLWRGEYGRDRHWADWIGRQACRSDGLWHMLTARQKAAA